MFHELINLGRDQFMLGYVLERESDSKFALNYYENIGHKKRIVIQRVLIELFSVDEIIAHSNNFETLKTYLFSYVGNKDLWIREDPQFISIQEFQNWNV